jgi:hypothetical protein
MLLKYRELQPNLRLEGSFTWEHLVMPNAPKCLEIV